jgi:O-antigen/teichoic acid export membrane protein
MNKILNNHIIMSGFYKGISGLSLFVSIRLLIDYLGEENYGIWVLVFTLFQLVLLMDFGIQSTLKTKIPVFVHENKIEKLSSYISSTYKISLLIAAIIFLVFFIISKTTNLKDSFNITGLDYSEINFLFLLNVVFFCATFVANIHKSLYVAFLKGKFAEQSIAINQIVFLLLLIVLVSLPNKSLSNFDKILNITLLNGFVSFTTNIFYTYKFFYKEKIQFHFLNFKNQTDLKDIFLLGFKFMVIQIGFLFVFSTDSYIISNVFGPKEVVAYEVVGKLFQFPYMILFAATTPFWSLFAKNYLEKNKQFLFANFKKFNQLFLLVVIGLFILVYISPYIISIWIKDIIHMSNYLIILTAILTGLKIYVNFYILFLSGIGKLNFYITILIISLLIKIPLSYYFVDLNFGINSVLLSSIVIVLFWAILIPFKCYKITKSITDNE